MTRTVIVIGAGPAGLAAGAAAAQAGARVIMLDAARRAGGQFWRHPDPRLSVDHSLQHGWRRFRQLQAVLDDNPDARLITEAQVWAIDHDRHGTPVVEVAVGPIDGPGRTMQQVRGDALIIATGAHDLTLPFPGWDLPGVFTGGAAQTMAKAEGVAVGRRVLVAGSGPFLLPVATSVASTGAEVIGVYEASSVRTTASSWLPQAPWLAGKLPELAGYLAGLARHKINYRSGRAVIAAHGDGRLERVTVARIDRDWRPVAGTERDLSCDALCISHGFTPRLELAIAAGCEITPDRFVAVDVGQRTTVPSVFAAGESTGIGGADLALAEGRIAGHLAAGGNLTDTELRRPLLTRRRLRHLTVALAAAHRIGSGWTDWLRPDTLICRCEEVTCHRLRTTIADTDTRGLRSLKLSSRVGLGPCQGRICGPAVELIMADHAPGLDGVRLDRRPVAVPIRLRELAERTSQAQQEPHLPGGHHP